MSGTDQDGDDEFLSGLDGEVGEAYGVPPVELSDAARYATMAPRDILIEMSWRAMQPPRNLRGMPGGVTLAMIVQVPTEAWVHPIGDFMRDNDPRIVLIEGRARPKEKVTSDTTIVDGLDRGLTVAGIAVDPETQLPALLRGAADVVMTIPAPTPALMRRVIRAFTGRRCPAFDVMDIAGLDLSDLVAALRPQSSPASCVKRLKRASAAKSIAVTDDTPLLADLAGYGEAKAWCLDMLADIAAVRDAALSAGELESAVFHGPPGTGKTLLARSLARTTRLPLVQTSVGAWFQQKSGHLGDVIQLIDEAFTRAKNSAPSILFLDELDAIPDRRSMDSRAREWWTSVVTSLLLQIDAARASKRGVILLAATNHLEHIDPALLRPGRFDQQFRIDPPDTAGLAGIMRSHLGADCPDADLMSLARLMPGATGADVTGIVRTARRRARTEGRSLMPDDLRAAILPVDVRTPDDIRHVALHEAGHAVVAKALGFEVPTVSIKGTANAGGWTDIAISPIPTRDDIERRVMVLLAGRAANVAFGAKPDSGAVSDLIEATRLLGTARVTFGLGETLVVRAQPDEVLGLVARDRILADAVEADLRRLMTRTEVLVSGNREAISRLADLLIERLVLDAGEIPALAAPHSADRSNQGRLRHLPGPASVQDDRIGLQRGD
ncbi:AAA family ATPase [Bosea sp. TAB14]|uniref:AAA family ATPase n=1 Tax=Bosea sp. TAB14 TaxID=3237481 RepID=UPI003F93523F